MCSVAGIPVVITVVLGMTLCKTGQAGLSHLMRMCWCGGKLIPQWSLGCLLIDRRFLARRKNGGRRGPRVRRETGRRRGCKSLTMKGRANRIVPESCVAGCEAKDEALTGVTVGQVLSRESSMFRDADAVCGAEGSTVGCVIASALPVPRGLRPWHAVETFCLGTGRSHDRPCCKGRPALGRPEGRSQ